MNNVICTNFEPDTSGGMWTSQTDVMFTITGLESREDLFIGNALNPEVTTAILKYIEAHKGDNKFAEGFLNCFDLGWLNGISKEEIEKAFDITGLEHGEEQGEDDLPYSFYKLPAIEQLKRAKLIKDWLIDGMEESCEGILLLDKEDNEI